MSRIEEQALQFDQEKIDKCIEAIQKVAEAIVELYKKFVETFNKVLGCLWDALKQFLKQENPKLYRLAYYHPKQRVRKKNRVRLFKMFRRISYDR